jgi:thymidine phosphorylase
MSKKLAEGIDALVLDVKTGSGAFMKKEEDAEFLAELMVETGQLVGKKIVALITDMNQPLGTRVGNSLEVMECIEVLKGAGPDDLRELCFELAGWMFYLGGIEGTPDLGKRKAAQLLQSGEALEVFRKMIKLQGGDESVIDDPSLLPASKHTREVVSSTSGFVAEINCHAIGVASVILGGGRAKKEDAIDPSVGIVVHRRLGDTVRAGEPLCTIHYNSEAQADQATALLQKCFRISEVQSSRENKLVHKVIGGKTGVSPVEA